MAINLQKGQRVSLDGSMKLALADVVKDESINRNNAYFYENGRGKEKFRPYSTPMKDWLDGLCKKMRNEIR